VQTLVEREAAHAKEKAALESAQAQAKWELEARIRDLEGELRQALQGEGYRNDLPKLRGQRPSKDGRFLCTNFESKAPSTYACMKPKGRKE
jgi:hypothetical protein